MARLMRRLSGPNRLRRLGLPTLRRKSLVFEPLEGRQMLAVLGLDVQVLADDGGTPGDPVAEVVAGNDFWLQVRAEDIRPEGETPAGVIALPVNLDWPTDPGTTVIEFSGPVPPEFPAAILASNPIVTADFTEQRFVDDFDPANGTILNLRGGALPAAGLGEAIGADGPEEFSRMLFTAVGAGVITPVDVALAGAMSFADAAALDGTEASPGTIRVVVEVTGQKFRDQNGDGVKDDGESGLPGWQIQAYRDLNENGLLDQAEFDAGAVDEDTTDADGDFVLRLGTGDPDDENPVGTTAHYVIVEVLQSGWTQTAPGDDVLAPVLDTGGLALGEFGYTVIVEPGDTEGPSDRDFGNSPPPATSSLSGFVYADVDNNGIRKVDEYGSPIELGLPDVLIGLYLDGSDTPLRQVTTDPAGRYQFEDLGPGTYRIREEVQPECFNDGQETLGIILPDGESRGVAGEDEFTDVELGEGEHGVDYNFGELGLKAACINKRMFLASTPSAKETVAERQDVPTSTVLGTDGDDVIEIEADLAAPEPALLVTVNGTEQSFPISESRMLFVDAMGGDDRVTMTLTEPDEKAYMLPGYASFRHEVVDGVLRDWDYGVEVFNGEDVEEVDLAPGGNLTVIRDTPQSDALTAADDTVTVTAEKVATEDAARIARVLTADALDRVQAISASGGDDTEEQTLPLEFLLELIGPWQTP